MEEKGTNRRGHYTDGCLNNSWGARQILVLCDMGHRTIAEQIQEIQLLIQLETPDWYTWHNYSFWYCIIFTPKHVVYNGEPEPTTGHTRMFQEMILDICQVTSCKSVIRPQVRC